VKVPRDLSGKELIRTLERIGYVHLRTEGSHASLVSKQFGEHHIAVPLHKSLKLGTLSGIVNDIAEHRRISKQEALEILFG
jgi:predicted RNA binding protein YcfA (HicA-like mRNA interferase family)